MLAIMEKYQENLEELVEERTEQLIEEKKKTDALLHRMLPRYCKTDALLHRMIPRYCSQQPYPATGRKEMFYLTTHSTHFIYGYMASDIR